MESERLVQIIHEILRHADGTTLHRYTGLAKHVSRTTALTSEAISRISLANAVLPSRTHYLQTLVQTHAPNLMLNPVSLNLEGDNPHRQEVDKEHILDLLDQELQLILPQGPAGSMLRNPATMKVAQHQQRQLLQHPSHHLSEDEDGNKQNQPNIQIRYQTTPTTECGEIRYSTVGQENHDCLTGPDSTYNLAYRNYGLMTQLL